MLNESSIIDLRKDLIELLEKSEGIVKLNIPSDVLERILFDVTPKGKIFNETIRLELLKKIDFSNISFDNFAGYFDFRGFHGVKINPQTFNGRDLKCCNFSGVEFIGKFDGCKIRRSNFEGSSGAIINLQTVNGRDLGNCNFSGVEFIGKFDGCSIAGSNFEGSSGAIINPQTINGRDLSNCNFSGVEFIGLFDNCRIGSSFKGSSGAKIDPQKIWFRDLSCCKFSGVEFIGKFDDCVIYRSNFEGSIGAKIDPQKIWFRDLSCCNFSGVEFIGKFDGCSIDGSSFKNSKGAIIDFRKLSKGNIRGTDLSDTTIVTDYNDILKYISYDDKTVYGNITIKEYIASIESDETAEYQKILTLLKRSFE